MSEFDSYEAAIEAVRRAIDDDTDLPEVLKPALCEQAQLLVERHRRGGAGWETESSPSMTFRLETTWPPNRRTGSIGTTYWVIRNEHLGFLKSLSGPASQLAGLVAGGVAGATATGAAVGSAAAGATIAAAAVAPIAVGLLVAMFTVMSALRKKGVQLEARDYELLMALKHNGPQSEDDLPLILNGLRVTGANTWTKLEVHDRLTSLHAAISRSGIEELVKQAGNGLWVANDI
jgi:hypothetical protein